MLTILQLPVIAVVGNDASWSQIAREQVPMFGTSVACDLARCDYQRVAEGYGGAGARIEQHVQIAAALDTAKQAAKTTPYLINAVISKSSFREGSISV